MTAVSGNKKAKYKSSADSNILVYGKVPPQAKELEEAVLGAVMLEKSAFDTVAEILKPECFYVDAHQRVFKVMQVLQQKNQPIDILTVVEGLKSNDELELVGGPYFVTRLTNAVVSSANIEAHARIIVQKFIQREIIRISGETINDSYNSTADVFDLLQSAVNSLSELGAHAGHGGMVGIESVVVKTLGLIEHYRGAPNGITGVPSGFQGIDRATRGWQPGDLIVIAARPSVGKTAFALNLIRTAANKATVAVFSLEMQKEMLVMRMLAAESKFFLDHLQTGRLNDRDLERLQSGAADKLSRLNIFFDDSPGLNISKLKTKARQLKKKKNLGLIVIDYLQLMSPSDRQQNREQQVSEISRELKTLAQELKIPIIALSQLNRDIEKRTGTAARPQLSDIRESGSIEQDADVAIFLWGPSDSEISQNAEIADRRYVRIAKQRNGMLYTEELDFKNEIQLFTAIETVAGWKPMSEAKS